MSEVSYPFFYKRTGTMTPESGVLMEQGLEHGKAPVGTRLASRD